MLEVTIQNAELTAVHVSRPMVSMYVASLFLKGDPKDSARIVCSGPNTQRGSPEVAILKRITRANDKSDYGFLLQLLPKWSHCVELQGPRERGNKCFPHCESK